MVPSLTNVEAREEVSSLPRTSQHTCHATFHGCYLRSGSVIGRVLQSSVEISTLFQVEEFTHLLARFILKSCTLYDRHLSWFTFPWIIS